MKNLAKLIFPLIIAVVFVPQFLFAQATSTASSTSKGIGSYTLVEPLPCIAGTGTNCAEGTTISQISISGYVGYIFKFAIAISVFLATVMVIYGGFEVMLSEIPSVKVEGKDRIKNAVMGLVAALASYLILQTIDPRLVQVSTDIPPIKVNTAEVQQYQNNLVRDLDKARTEDREAILAVNNQLDELNRKMDELQKKMSGPVGSSTQAEAEANLTEFAKLRQQIQQKNSVKVLTTADSLDKVYFNEAVKGLRDANARTAESAISNAPINDSAIANAKTQSEKILQIYDDAIKDPADPNLALTADARQQLLYKKNFYYNQVNEELTFNQVLAPYQAVLPQYVGKAEATKFEKAIVDYVEKNESILTNLSLSGELIQDTYKGDIALKNSILQIQSDPVLLQQYREILQDRNNFAKNVIAKKRAEGAGK